MAALMKNSVAIGLLALAGVAQAVTAGVTVHSSTGGVTTPGEAADGYTPPDFTLWTTDSASWSGTLANATDTITFKLDQAYHLSSAVVTLDWNDFYRFSVSTNGVNYTPLFTLSGLTDQSVVNSGQVTMSTSFAPTALAYQYVRVQAIYGDGFYSVGEVSFSGTMAPVPEPSAIALMLGGIGLVGFVARRRSRR